MFSVREANLEDVEGIRDIFLACYDEDYPYRQFLEPALLQRLVFAEDTILLVAEEQATGRICGTASVVFAVGAFADLAAEFGRLAVLPEFRGHGLGKLLMEGRLERVRERIHVGIVENRVAHPFSQKISVRNGFIPVGLLPLKLKVHERESVALYARYFGDALTLRKNHPHTIPEVYPLAELSLRQLDLHCDVIVDVETAPYPHIDDFELQELTTEGHTALLRFQRGRTQNREVFGPVQLHYGLFQIRARHCNYLLARRDGQLVGGIGFMVDNVEHIVRVFELISVDEQPVHFLLERLLEFCRRQCHTEYIEVDLNAHAPRMQQTLLELGFLPAAYVPALVFHNVERLDVVKFVKLLTPPEFGGIQLHDDARAVARLVTDQFRLCVVLPELTAAMPRIPLFAGMTIEQARQVASICELTQFETGNVIFRENDPASRYYVILDGQVDICCGSESEKVGTIGPGESLAEGSLVAGINHSATARAATTVRAATATHASFKTLIHRRPDIGVVLFRNVARGLRDKLQRSDRYQIEQESSNSE